MHYVRFLRAPALRPAPRGGNLDLVLTLTNDLGENLLNLQRPLELAVTLHQRLEAAGEGGEAGARAEEKVTALSIKGQVVWKPGSRVIKTTITLPGVVYANLRGGRESWIQVSPAVKTVVADGARKIVGAVEGRGLIMPAWHLVSKGEEGQEDEGSQIVYRKLKLAGELEEGEKGTEVVIGEEIKDSIARHVWDGGVVALCAVAEAVSASEGVEVGSTMGMVRELLTREGEVKTILELGCGIGTLGIGLASLLDGLDSPGREILMTDLEDAEEIVEVNLKGFESRRKTQETEKGVATPTQIAYENLDWMDARHGTFNEKVAASAWDLIILSDCTYNEDTLSALVDTLSAIHEHNVKMRAGGEEEEGQKATTKLFLATKHRHESEMEAFELLRRGGWVVKSDEVQGLPFLEGESQRVQMCVFEKM